MRKKYSDPLMFSNVMLSGVVADPSQQGGPLFSTGKLGVSRPQFVEEGSYSNEVSIPGQEEVQNQTEGNTSAAESEVEKVITEEIVGDVMEQITGSDENPEQATDTP